MKNIILGCIGVFISFYTLLAGLDILTLQTNKNEMERHVSRIVKNVLEAEYQKGEEVVVKQILSQEITNSVSPSGEVKVEIKAMDLQKGLLSVSVKKRIKMLNGKDKEIVVEKTAIMDRSFLTVMD